MAMSPEASEARRRLQVVTGHAGRAFEAWWGSADLADPVVVRGQVVEVLPLIGETFADAAAVVGADFYDAVRESAAPRGRFQAEPAPLPDSARLRATARWGLAPLFQPDPDPPAALSLIEGGLQRYVVDAHTTTVVEAARSDAAAKGWRREGAGACDFCRMLIGRGEVYSADTAGFASHDRCHCVAVPAFNAGPPVTVQQYAASKRRRSEADRQKVRDYLAAQRAD